MPTALAQSKSFRASALAVAFSVVAGGAALIGAPAFADTPAPTTSAPTTSAPATTAPATTAPAQATPKLAISGSTFTQAAVTQNGVAFSLSGFAPGTTFTGMIEAPGTEPVPVQFGTDGITDANGAWTGTLKPKDLDWVAGDYTLSIASTDGTQQATGSFTVMASTAAAAPSVVIVKDEDAVFTQSQAAADGVSYESKGWKPGASLRYDLILPDQTVIPLSSGQTGTADADGTTNGTFTTTGTWVLGDYVIVIVDEQSNERATVGFTVVADDAAVATGTQAPATAAPVQPVSGGTGTSTLASTGVEADFGPAGLALGLLVAGAGAIVISRRALTH